jgi:transposase
MGKVLYKVTLTQEERADLLSLTKKGKNSARKVIHALILLNCDEGDFAKSPKKSNKSIAELLNVGESMVERVKKRFVEDSIEAALDDKPSEREYKCKVDGDLEAHLIAMSCGAPPAGYSRWSLRLLADKVVEYGYIDSISHETIRRRLKKTN